MRDRVVDKALVNEIRQWCGEIAVGHTRFLNIHDDCGTEAVKGPAELIERIDNCWNEKDKYDLIFAQIVRAPVARRVASPYVDPNLCPWRKTILITERDTCRVEDWVKIYGIGSVTLREEQYRAERIQWAIHIFGRERIVGISAGTPEEEAASVQELLKSWTTVDLPRSLGRLTKFLMSSNQKQRLRGLQVLHKRFWHAKFPTLRLLLDRAGVDLDDKEIKVVIDACPVCRKWQQPPLPPKVKTDLPEKV
jgi:hypothetical protein